MINKAHFAILGELLCIEHVGSCPVPYVHAYNIVPESSEEKLGDFFAELAEHKGMVFGVLREVMPIVHEFRAQRFP